MHLGSLGFEKLQNFLWGFVVVVVSKVKCPQQYFFMEITSNHHKVRDSRLCALVFKNSTQIILENMPTQGSISTKKQNICSLQSRLIDIRGEEMSFTHEENSTLTLCSLSSVLSAVPV